MANKRKEGKTRVAVWLTEEERKALEALVKTGAVRDMSEFIKQAINEEANRKGISVK